MPRRCAALGLGLAGTSIVAAWAWYLLGRAWASPARLANAGHDVWSPSLSSSADVPSSTMAPTLLGTDFPPNNAWRGGANASASPTMPACSLHTRFACLVSVITPFCTRVNATLNAIASIAAQTHRNHEHILILDDMTVTNRCAVSLNEMKSLVELSYGTEDASRIKLVSAREECGSCPHGYKAPGFVRNIGIRLAKGHYLAFLDDDDLALENRLELQLFELLSNKAKFGFAEAFALESTSKYAGRFQYDGTFVPLNSSRAYIRSLRLPLVTKDVTMAHMQNIHKWKVGVALPRQVTASIMRQHNVIITSTVMLNANFLRFKKIAFNPMLEAGKEDWTFWMQILSESGQPVLFTPIPLGVQDLMEHGRWRGGAALGDADSPNSDKNEATGEPVQPLMIASNITATECSVRQPLGCLVSVVTPFCTRINATLNAVASVTRQTHANWEMILILDDATSPMPCAISLAEMQELVAQEAIGDHRVVVVSAKENCAACKHGIKAPGFSRNIGLRLASPKAQYVVFLDDDDLMTEDRLQVQVSDMLRTKAKLGFAEAYAMQRNSLYLGRFSRAGDGAFHRLESTQAKAKALGFRYVVRDLTMRHMVRFHEWDANEPLPRLVPYVLLKTHNVVITSTVMANLTFLRSKHIEFDPFLEAGDEDRDFWLRIGDTCRCPIRFFPLPLGFLDIYEHGRKRVDTASPSLSTKRAP